MFSRCRVRYRRQFSRPFKLVRALSWPRILELHSKAETKRLDYIFPLYHVRETYGLANRLCSTLSCGSLQSVWAGVRIEKGLVNSDVLNVLFSDG
ncbi:hypothetical protein HRM2_01280 [Desulforapulum autotrophicum HRM2]|uniref:Uncharacterized protein n=1 Tax=Desulforapulum autotrophicum (strain ATCC 43914 / DSM 3382 / VKM B-1955 / HRM2) TaxID=177437 RepID=C0QED4_DESAH|nr:hypothetical protein HRM2_01280 [Desulforapulum autotrophicum HRM2]